MLRLRKTVGTLEVGLSTFCTVIWPQGPWRPGVECGHFIERDSSLVSGIWTLGPLFTVPFKGGKCNDILPGRNTPLRVGFESLLPHPTSSWLSLLHVYGWKWSPSFLFLPPYPFFPTRMDICPSATVSQIKLFLLLGNFANGILSQE